jgi:2,3-bisphosphoglycerate-dependent phosphoglycerate mutase
VSDRILLAFRHGPVDAKGLCYGQFNVPELEAPEHVARGILSNLGGCVPERVIASPLARAKGPATHIASTLGLTLEQDPRVSELSMGAWEGLLWVDVEAEYGGIYTHWMEHWKAEAPPGGETVAQLSIRVSAFVHTLPQGCTLLVAHAGVIRALRVLQGKSWDDAMSEPVPYGSRNVFTWPA